MPRVESHLRSSAFNPSSYNSLRLAGKSPNSSKEIQSRVNNKGLETNSLIGWSFSRRVKKVSGLTGLSLNQLWAKVVICCQSKSAISTSVNFSKVYSRAAMRHVSTYWLSGYLLVNCSISLITRLLSPSNTSSNPSNKIKALPLLRICSKCCWFSGFR